MARNSDTNILNESLRIAAFNCQGAMRNAVYVSHLLDKLGLDIVCLCEHWLSPDSLSFLNSISLELCSYAVCDNTLSVIDRQQGFCITD